jgi:hypothetical protein
VASRQRLLKEFAALDVPVFTVLGASAPAAAGGIPEASLRRFPERRPFAEGE